MEQVFLRIYDAMENNGSPAPVFETDDETYVLVTLPAHEFFDLGAQESDRVNDQADSLILSSLDDIISFCNQAGDQVSVQVNDQVIGLVSEEVGPYSMGVLEALGEHNKSRRLLLENLGLTNHTKNKEKVIDPLLKIGWVEYTIPENPRNRNQRYKLTESGKRLLALIESNNKD